LKRYLILLPLIWLAFWLRVWQLPHIPPGLWYDEAYYSMDAAWLLDGGPWRLFFVGNNGREPIFIYLQTLFIWLFGAFPLTSRLIGPLAGTLTVPLVYILARRLAHEPDATYSYDTPHLKTNNYPLSTTHYLLSTWLPYLAATGLAISYWHLTLSRSGFRGILLPLVATFVFYAFWRGWQENNWRWLALAGLALGVSQYTYLAARLLPLVLAIFALAWTALNWRDSARLKMLWLGLSLMALIAAAVFAPLGWLFYQNPTLFSARTGDVLFTPDSPGELFQHLSDALRLFVDGGDPGWRHNLPGRPMLGWLGWLGFGPGLFICLRHPRRANHLFLAIALLTLYLPALFAVPPAHALRLSTLLPIYYIIFALGLIAVVRLTPLTPRLMSRVSRSRLLAVILIAVMIIETGLTFFDYFYRWARAEETYVEFNGPLVDFVNEVIAQTAQTTVIIPFQLYVHPTTRYLLYDHFTEQTAPADLSGPVQLVTLPNDFKMLNVASIPVAPAWVWLGRDPSGKGVAYVSRPPRREEQAYLNRIVETTTPEIYRDRFDRELAHRRLLPDPSPLFSMFTDPAPERTISLTWADLVQLKGYDVLPPVIQPGQPLTLNFYWHSLTDETFDKRLFLQLIDRAGNPINQWEGEAFREDMYRWRPDGILPSQHTLWLGPDSSPGPYLVRLGFFDKNSGQRLPIQIGAPASQYTAEGATITDQVQLGLFYVSPDGRDPRQPAIPLSATFGDSIKLIGVTLPQYPEGTMSKIQNPKAKIEVTFHWQSLQPTDKPYTVFLQLLDERGKVVTSWDSQPFNGLYPTTLWSPGEIIADTFSLPLPNEGLPPGAYRLITGFYDVATGQRLPVDNGGDFVELGEFGVE
jgi:4-amino-4-deoxy-L-arabinose transferase-like glycosyltransferase